MTTRQPKPWIVHHRNGWCALPPGAAPDPEAISDPTLCGHVVTMRRGHKRGAPDCLECLTRMAVLALPRRVAHSTHALMEAWTARIGSGPVTTAEVCEYDDPEAARTVRHTAAALARARKLGLAMGARGLWSATDYAWLMRRALEDRFHAEVSL